jgi:hypothetical protein
LKLCELEKELGVKKTVMVTAIVSARVVVVVAVVVVVVVVAAAIKQVNRPSRNRHRGKR